SFDGNAKMSRQMLEIAATSAGHHDAVAGHGWSDAPLDKIGCHQARDLESDLTDLPRERRRRQTREHPFEALLRQTAGQEDDVFHTSANSSCREASARPAASEPGISVEPASRPSVRSIDARSQARRTH